MGRRWIMVELGEHCHTHIIPRLKKVIDGEDQAVSRKRPDGRRRRIPLLPARTVAARKGPLWQSRSSASSTTLPMLAEAMCKIMGFTYAPSDELTGSRAVPPRVTSSTSRPRRSLASSSPKLSDEVGDNRSLLICCAAFRGKADAFPNLTIKKIPSAVLAKCEWGHDDYSLNVANLPKAAPRRDPTRHGDCTGLDAKAGAPQGGSGATQPLFVAEATGRCGMKSAGNTIANRLSLRSPQRESLEILDRVCDLLALSKDQDAAQALAAIRAEFPTSRTSSVTFPSLCFALATGVGKTRLMGAFIAYLHQAEGIRHFFVLAPNLTIYNKLIADFTPGTPKYVFQGLSDFVIQPPEIITGDNYESGRGVRSERLIQPAIPGLKDPDAPVHINIFNISKINSEVRGGAEPRIKRLQEYIGESYFEYLSGLDDLVLLMDESHRYRGKAGMRAINELKPILGLELTATPRTEDCRRRRLQERHLQLPAVVCAARRIREGAGRRHPRELPRGQLRRGGTREAEAGGRRSHPRTHQGPARHLRPRKHEAAGQAVHAGRRQGHDPRQRPPETDRSGGLFRRPVQGAGDYRSFQPNRRGEGRDGSAASLGRRPRKPDRDRDSRQHAERRLGRDEPLHHRPASGGEFEDAGRAVHRARLAPSLWQAHGCTRR